MNGLYFPIIALVAFVALFVALHLIGGTRNIARRFPATHRPTGKRYYFAWGTLNGTTWKYGLDLVVAQGGLYMGTILPFRLFNPPVFLPWSRVQVTQEHPYFVDRVEILIHEVDTIISFRGSEARAILQASQAHQN